MKLLITKQLSEDQLGKIQAWGWSCDVVPALRISQRTVTDIPSADAWVVSSRNSLDTVEKFITQSPAVIYVVGDWIQKRLTKLTDAEVKNFPEMHSLANEVATAPVQTILYFCADNHREELAIVLSHTGKKMVKVITHDSQLTFPKLNDVTSYDTVVVFSPRSVESLLRYNDFAQNILFMSIGPTTDIFLRRSGFTNTFYASAPDTDLMLDELFNYFKINKLPNGL